MKTEKIIIINIKSNSKAAVPATRRRKIMRKRKAIL